MSIVDTESVWDDISWDAALADPVAEADAVIAVAVGFLPAEERDTAVVDHAGIIAAIKAEAKAA